MLAKTGATASARLDDLLASIEEEAGSPTLAPSVDLSAIQAGREHLRARRGEASTVWCDDETGGLALSGADLAGAVFSHAVLDGANLRGANLVKVIGHGTDLSHAVLESARCNEADLNGANFGSALGGEADFTSAMLEDAHFEHASLRYAILKDTLLDAAVFTSADLWGASLESTDADEALFRRARLDESRLVNGNFARADFSDASLKKADLTGAKLIAANFSGARLEGAKLTGADLTQASLPRLNLLSCELKHVRLAGAWLELTRLQAHQLGGAVGEEIDRDYEAARQAYIGLEQNFRSLGDSDDASWAFRKRRVMGKRHRATEARQAVKRGAVWPAIDHGARWIADVFVEWLCDYGESLWRVIRAFFVMIGVFAIGYGLFGALTKMGPGSARIVTRDLFDLLAYSFLNMLSTSAPDIGIKPANELVVIMSSLQGATGIVLIGLFGYVLGNRMHQ